jgi:hypothetical protein
VVRAEGYEGYEWDYRKLPERLQNRASAEPQTITLDALMAVAKENLLAGNVVKAGLNRGNTL